MTFIKKLLVALKNLDFFLSLRRCTPGGILNLSMFSFVDLEPF